jgi:hypothetical protein
VNPPELRALRRLARDLHLPPGALQTAVECGVLTAEQSEHEHTRTLRQLRRLMDDLGVNAPAAALLVRMARDLRQMQAELAQLRHLETRYFAAWEAEGWREIDDLSEWQ